MTRANCPEASLRLSLLLGREDVCGIFGVLPEVWYRLQTTHCVGNTPVDSANLPSFAPIISTLNEKEDTKETKKSSPRWGKGRCS